MRTPSGLLIPGSSRGLQIHVPKGYEDEGAAPPTMICRVPTGHGQVCGAIFYPGEESAWNTHVGRCARQHEGEIHELSPKNRVPIIHDPNHWDPEAEEHLRQVGQRMLAEGRLVLRPNERVGS